MPAQGGGRGQQGQQWQRAAGAGAASETTAGEWQQGAEARGRGRGQQQGQEQAAGAETRQGDMTRCSGDSGLGQCSTKWCMVGCSGSTRVSAACFAAKHIRAALPPTGARMGALRCDKMVVSPTSHCVAALLHSDRVCQLSQHDRWGQLLCCCQSPHQKP